MMTPLNAERMEVMELQGLGAHIGDDSEEMGIPWQL